MNTAPCWKYHALNRIVYLMNNSRCYWLSSLLNYCSDQSIDWVCRIFHIRAWPIIRTAELLGKLHIYLGLIFLENKNVIFVIIIFNCSLTDYIEMNELCNLLTKMILDQILDLPCQAAPLITMHASSSLFWTCVEEPGKYGHLLSVGLQCCW